MRHDPSVLAIKVVLLFRPGSSIQHAAYCPSLEIPSSFATGHLSNTPRSIGGLPASTLLSGTAVSRMRIRFPANRLRHTWFICQWATHRNATKMLFSTLPNKFSVQHHPMGLCTVAHKKHQRV